MKKQITITASAIAAFFATNGLAEASQTHTVKENTTIEDVAQTFATTTQQINELNQINTYYINAGTELEVPDNDIVEVKAGDNLSSIAQAHGITLDDLYAFNPGIEPLIFPGDLVAVSSQGAASLQASKYEDGSATEINRLNSLISEEDTNIEPTVAPGYDESYSAEPVSYQNESNAYTNYVNYNTSLANNGNQYAFGNCTYYAFDRRNQLGRGIGSYWGNANNWAASALSAGFNVNNTPEVGAIFQTGAGDYGHVGIVESVNSDGSINVSEMNYNGHFNDVTYRTISNVYDYNYIH